MQSIPLKDICSFLEDIAPLRFQESYDNAGLITGDPEMQITGAMIALDALPEVIEEAIETNCNMVISHHPLVFRGIKKFNPHYYVDKGVILALKHDIALYAIHTNLDNVLSDGVNQKIGNMLGLQDISILRPHPSAHMETSYHVGSGIKGRLPEEMATESFIEYLKERLQLKVIRHTNLIGPIRKVAVCGGAGSFLLNDAIKAGMDCFITADMKYHEFFDANSAITIFDIGHYESEYFTIQLLHRLISNKFHNFAAHCTKVNTNPVFYS